MGLFVDFSPSRDVSSPDLLESLRSVVRIARENNQQKAPSRSSNLRAQNADRQRIQKKSQQWRWIPRGMRRLQTNDVGEKRVPYEYGLAWSKSHDLERQLRRPTARPQGREYETGGDDQERRGQRIQTMQANKGCRAKTAPPIENQSKCKSRPELKRQPETAVHAKPKRGHGFLRGPW